MTDNEYIELGCSTPLLIYGSKHELLWSNPDALQILKFDDDEQYSSTPVHRVWLYDSKGSMILTVILKSPPLDVFWKSSFAGDEEHIRDQARTDEIVGLLLMDLEVAFLEDVWAPGGEQFCFTKIGRTIGTRFKKVRSIQFSPDCCVWYNSDSDEPLGYDT